jgi:hypothetical protein
VLVPHRLRSVGPRSRNGLAAFSCLRRAPGVDTAMWVECFRRSPRLLGAFAFCLLVGGVSAGRGSLAAAAPRPSQASSANQPSQAATRRQVGTIRSIEDNRIVLSTDAGDVNVVVQDGARIVRVEPGQKDLTGATVLALKDLEAGDRILVRGEASADGKSLAATVIIAMKHEDVAAKQQQERAEWQHGIGGLVVSVDRSAGVVMISRGSSGASSSIPVHISKDTIIRRYAPDSVKFDDAKASTLEAIRPGDQLRARGTPDGSGNGFTADEVVSGSFQNIAGSISSVDIAGNTILVSDAITKHPISVKITDQSQVRKLPPEMAQRIAARLRATPDAQANPARSSAGGSESNQAGMQGINRGRTPDLQQLLGRIPTVKLADLQTGEEVMIVSTQSNSSGQVTAITLLAGVAPLLTAAPRAAQAMMLAPWSLGSGDAGADDTNP